MLNVNLLFLYSTLTSLVPFTPFKYKRTLSSKEDVALKKKQIHAPLFKRSDESFNLYIR